MALPCASAERSHLLPELFDDFSVCRRLSPRESAIISEANETVFVLDLLETDGTVGSESCDKVHTVVSDFRPPSVT